MPKIQVYVNNAALDKINDIVEEKRQGGASIQDASISSTASMLIELGIRVYCIQLERGRADSIRLNLTEPCWNIWLKPTAYQTSY